MVMFMRIFNPPVIISGKHAMHSETGWRVYLDVLI